MQNGFNHDGVLKDLFQEDRPTLLDTLTGGVPVKEFLNVEIPKVLERRLDLVMRLADGSILHIELQSTNDPNIAFREGVYCFLVGNRYRGCKIRQVVLYVGRRKMRMPSGVDFGQTKGEFRLLDIREIDADTLLASRNPADKVLALLAGGGDERIAEVVRAIATLRGSARERAFAQLSILSGLRGLARRVELEMKQMGVVIDINDNPVLLRWDREARQRGRAEMLSQQLVTKFGRLPKWASERVRGGTSAQLTRWGRKVLTVDTLEGVLGEKTAR